MEVNLTKGMRCDVGGLESNRCRKLRIKEPF